MRRHFLPLLVFCALAPAAATAGPSLLFDVASGKVLAEEDAFARWYPASLTKLMTAYVAFRAVESGEMTLLSPVRVTRKAAAEPPSKMGFPAGSVMTLDNALKMMLTKSANDIAMAVGENVAGSQAAFVRRMNEEAGRLGMVGTHFVNPHGLFSPDQYTTAHDLALLVRALRTEFPQHAGYFSIEALGVGGKTIPTLNALIGRFDGADGMKTGYVCESGFNFVGTATRGGRTLAAVVLGADTARARAAEVAALLAQGFAAPEGDGAPTLSALAPDASATREATNRRAELCVRKKGKQAAKAPVLSETSPLDDEKGPLVMGSPYLHELERPRNVVTVGLGGATGPGGLPPEVETVSVPVPTPRPDYVPPAKRGKKPAAPLARAQSSAVQ